MGPIKLSDGWSRRGVMIDRLTILSVKKITQGGAMANNKLGAARGIVRQVIEDVMKADKYKQNMDMAVLQGQILAELNLIEDLLNGLSESVAEPKEV